MGVCGFVEEELALLERLLGRVGERIAKEMEVAIRKKMQEIEDAECGRLTSICGCDYVHVSDVASSIPEFWKGITEEELHALADFIVKKPWFVVDGVHLTNLLLLTYKIGKKPNTEVVLSFLRRLKQRAMSLVN